MNYHPMIAGGYPTHADAPLTEAQSAAGYRAHRHDGWTPERQRDFLEAIADGNSVEVACRIAGMSVSSAYSFRRRAAGAAFNLGWRAANLLAREHVADRLLTRAIDGYTETVTRPNGDVVERHRFDNRLAQTMLARLDRMAEDEGSAAANTPARLVAQEFDGYLDLIERDAGPARAGLFVATRDPALLGGAADADLQPVLGLARADRFLRAGAGGAGEVDTADLDPDQRHRWTGEQWVRAEAAGLVALAAEPEKAADEPASSPPLPPLHPASDVPDLEEEGCPVWFDDAEDCWITVFPPPEGFEGREHGEPGDYEYTRTLTPGETALVDRVRDRAEAGDLADQVTERDQWFARLAAAFPPRDEPQPTPPDPAG